MTVQLKLIPISLPLTSPAIVQNRMSRERNGILVLLSANEATGMGECIPLPGLHDETLESCFENLNAVKRNLASRSLTFNDTIPINLRLPYFGKLDIKDKLFPSCKFAVEQALFHLLIQLDPIQLTSTFASDSNFLCASVNGLTSLDEGSILDIAERISENHFSVVKIKIGRHSNRKDLLEEEIQFVKDLSCHLDHKVKLRLDANRSLNLDELLYFWEKTKSLPIDYFEEPLSGNFAITKAMYSRIDLPIALDESLRFYLPFQDRSELPSSVRALVIKPTTIGGISNTLGIIDFCNRYELQCVLSSAYDSGWATSFYVLLSKAIQNQAHLGLDTYRFLEKDLLVKRLELIQGQICISKTFFHQPPNILVNDFVADLTA